MGALCVASTKAAVIPVEELVDGLQSFLTAPEESGHRLKRSTGEWDKEFDLSSMGILFQLKYTNPANPFEGGRAHVKVPGARFVRNAPFDDMEMDIEFNGGSAIDGLFDMKVDYKFIQKFMFLADRPQEGSFVLYRKMEGGMWKTRVTVDNNNRMPKPFLDIAVESDRKTKLHVLFNFEEDNKWELKVDRVPGQKMTIEAVIDGQKWTGEGTLNQGDMKLNLKVDSEFTGKHYNLDFDLNPAGMWGLHVTGDVDGPVDAKWTMQKDWTMGEIVMKYKNQNYAFMQLKGNAEMRGMFPVMFDYVVKYNINDAEQHQGKAKLKFEARTPAKRFEINYAPKTGTPFECVFDFDLSAGFKYDWDLKVNGAQVEKATGDFTWVNNANKFELKSDETFTQTKENPFYDFNTMFLFGGRYVEKMEKTRNFFFDKVQKAQLLNKMKIEEEVILDEQTWYHIKYDNTAPKTAFLFTFLPYNMDRAWTYEGGREHTANGGFAMTHKITHGENVIQEGEMVFDVKANDGSKFEMEHLHKMTVTEESPFYGMVCWYTGRYGKTVERKMTFVFDKINKSFLFVPKMSMNTVMTIDGEKTSEFVFDNTQAKKHIKFFWAPDAFTKDYLFTDKWEYPAGGCKWTTDLKRGGVSIWNWVVDYSFINNANKFEFKTMDKVVQTPMSPLYGLDHFYVGKYYKNGERTRTITYEKQNRNFLLGKLFVEDKLMLDGERFGHFKLDTRATPYTMTWFSKSVRRLVPVVRDFTGQDELTVSAWHTPGKELKFETNLPEFQTLKVTSAGPTKKFEFNGKEVATVDFDSSSKKASHTMHLPSGKDLTIDLAWPKMTADASDLEFGVTITPDRKVVTKFGWEWAGVNKIKWTGHGETTKGFLRRVSPVETNVVTSVNMRNMKVDAIVWKSFAGQKYGFTLNNDKFTLLAGQH